MLLRTAIPFILSLRRGLCAALPSRHCVEHKFPPSPYTIPLYPPLQDHISNGVFSADITVGSQTLRVALDTGSADIWLLTDNAKCTAAGTLQPVPLDQCGYAGPRYIPDGNFETIPDEHLNISYGIGSTINGPLGYAKLNFGGASVPKQEISAATYASVGRLPEGNVSGLLGLAYPGITNAFPGSDPSKDVLCTKDTNAASCGPQTYSPFLTTVFNDNLTQPTFAFALSRSASSGGVMTLGGIPDVNAPSINATHGVAVTVPIEFYSNATILLLYVVTVDAFEYTGAPPNAGQGQFIVDTGTSINILSPTEASAFNALFDPPAIIDDSTGFYTVLCNATVPELGVKIGGQTFHHNAADMIIPVTGGDGVCLSAVQAFLTTVALPIIGAAFLKNVLAVFDVGGNEMTFISRVYYEDC